MTDILLLFLFSAIIGSLVGQFINLYLDHKMLNKALKSNWSGSSMIISGNVAELLKKELINGY